MRIAVNAYTASSAAGVGLDAIHASIASRQSGLRRNDFDGCSLDTWIGRIPSLESTSLPPDLKHLHSRNNQLAWLGLQQDGFLSAIENHIERFGAERIGVVMGTSTSSIGRTEEAYAGLDPDGTMAEEYCQPDVHNLHSPGIFVAAATGLRGPSMTLSTACSSSAKVFASAARWLQHGLVDAVLVNAARVLLSTALLPDPAAVPGLVVLHSR